MSAYEILNTEKSDLDFIYHLFDEAIAYQERNNFPVWPGYDKEILRKGIDYFLQYKFVRNNQIGYVFSICYNDKIIWGDKDNNDAIYLHRMVVNPKFKGNKLFGDILQWVMSHPKQNNLRFVRMDTWANNPSIITYYKSFGFKVVGYFKMPDTEELPIQQRNNDIVLLEVEL
jgi:ribosomal protein S18 acetylase RimI-like enzyme